MNEFGWKLEMTYESLPKIFYSRQSLKPVKKPKLIIFNDKLGKELGLNIEKLKSEEGVKILGGNQQIGDIIPLAQAYGGHQFGHFTMLGDGRALLLGEQITPEKKRYDIQLKGSGKTPYSRGGDGRAGIGPMLREYIISQGLHNLGIPTTRSLSVVESGEKIVRQKLEPGGILTRIALSHIRVGSFQYGSVWGEKEDLKKLADYTINRHYPESKEKENPYLDLLDMVIEKQASLIAKWQLVGFVHGVMNTDNMTISGEGIDYGPCAFMDSYSPKTVFSSIDREERYAYGNQPLIGQWNLSRFAETLLPLIHPKEDQAIKLGQEALDKFRKKYKKYYLEGMGKKLGIENLKKEEENLVDEILDLLEKHKKDYTNFFLDLTFNKLEDQEIWKDPDFQKWYRKWEKRKDSQALMEKSNPALIPRNYLVEEALDQAVRMGNYEKLHKLLQALEDPYNHDKDYGDYQKTPKTEPYKTYCGT